MRKKLWLFCTLFLGFISLRAQDVIYMPYFEVMNIHTGYQYSATRLFKSYVENNNKYDVILPEKYDSAYQIETFDQTWEKARTLRAAYFIKGELNRMGDVVIVTINMYTTGDGKRYWHTIAKAFTPDDIDPVMTKIAYHLGEKNKSGNEDIYNVTGYEARELNKIGSSRYFGLTIGGGYVLANNVSNQYPAGIGALFSYDNRNVIFDLKGEMFFTDIDIYYMSLDVLVPFSPKKSSFFLTGGTGYGGVSIKNKSASTVNYFETQNKYDASGLLFSAGGGFIINRNSDASFRITAKAMLPLFTVSHNRAPIGFLITTSLLFGR